MNIRTQNTQKSSVVKRHVGMVILVNQLRCSILGTLTTKRDKGFALVSTGSGDKCVSCSSSRCCKYDISKSKETSGYPNRGEPQAMQVELVWPNQHELLSSHDFASCEADDAKQDCASVGSHQTTKSRFLKRWSNKHKNTSWRARLNPVTWSSR